MDYEKNAIEILRMIGSNNGFTVADSGGKDSSVLTHIAMKAFEKMLIAREQAGLENKCGWTDAESVFRWWMEDKTDPNQMTIDDWLHEIGADYTLTGD